jgi:hypothetical protein
MNLSGTRAVHGLVILRPPSSSTSPLRPLFLPLCWLLATSASVAAPAATAPAPVFRPTLVAGTLAEDAAGTRVGPDGAEWMLPGGSSLTASPGAELRVIGKPVPLDLGFKRPVPGFTVILKAGVVRGRVPGSAKSAIVISAPQQTSVLVVSGETSVLAGRHVAVANTAGKTLVGTAGARMRALEPGMLEVLDAGVTSRRALLSSPRTLDAALLLVSQGEDTALGKLSWDTVTGASGYRVEVRELASDRLRARVETQAAELASDSVRLAPGGYRLRVVSLDSIGMESARPLERQLQVVRVSLPVGGYLEGQRAFRIPAGAKIGLAQADGLEMSYGTSAFVPVAPSLELSDGTPRLVRLRAPGQGEGESLWLLPRAARAQVSFEPRTPHWPAQPLTIRVRVKDASGAGAASWIEARPRVSVGVDAVTVPFTQDGEEWTGVLPPRSGQGPWVVRVEVADQNGVALGRDFVEVAAR